MTNRPEFFHLDEDDEDEAPEGKKEEAGSSMMEKALFDSRTILLTGDINDKIARSVSAQLLAYSAVSDKPILLVLSSPGGHVESGDMIHDVIKFINAPVRMLGTGWVASAGALIYCAAPRERRFCLPNTRFMVHQPAGGIRGTASDSYTVEDVFVPVAYSGTREDPADRNVPGALYAFTMQGLYAVGVAGVALGTAREMLADKLPEGEIALLVAWVKAGAPMPEAVRRASAMPRK